MSIVKRVLALLKIDVRSLMSAASITDSMRPFKPEADSINMNHSIHVVLRSVEGRERVHLTGRHKFEDEFGVGDI